MKKLIITNYQEKIRISDLEESVLTFWETEKIFEKSIEERPEKNSYVFYDGPPFATGLPHYGHILASTIKDIIPRYYTMKGFRVERVWGWDCHGIPIENMIEKELGLKGGKKGIEELGIDKFNAACRSAILRFDKEWEKVIARIGRWVDFKHSYKTMDKTYMESVWWAFNELYKKNLVYEGKRVILYCPRCATPLSNFEIAMDNSYKDLLGPSTVYKYKLKNQNNTYILAWSTTPWNKLATPALAVNPDLTYVKVKQGDDFYILAKDTVKILNETPAYEIQEVYKGRDLEQFEFELHYDFYPKRSPLEKAGVIIADNYVSSDEGTGVVTLAVYGEDDYRVMTAHNIQLVYHVDDEGKLKSEVAPWSGMFMLKVNPLVNEDLKKRGLIYRDEERMHSVPVCYRCETRLYQAPVPAWFIDIDKMKQDLIKQNEHIHWYPGHLKHGRFGKGLSTAPDWNISRSRYWGTPMPVWKSQAVIGDGRHVTRMIGSLAELKRWAVAPESIAKLTDIHREFLDDIEVWVDDEKTLKGKRIPEVFDCWVESGSMPYASIHYPFENKDAFKQSHPAQFIAEYIAQTRAWFYTLHVMSVGLFGSHTFENAVTTGTILAEDGTKMSKSKKNYPDPTLLFEKYGVDALRFYLMGSVVMKAENLNFSEPGVSEVYQRVISLLWNTFSFYKLYGNNQTVGGKRELHDLDRWILSKTNSLINEVTVSMDSYDTVTTCRHIVKYIDDLSTWYLRRSRERFKQNPASMEVFGKVLKQLILVMAPITPFITEVLYQNLPHAKESVHLELWPNADLTMVDEKLEEVVDVSRSIVEAILALRKENALPVKQPLESWSFDAKEANLFSHYPGILESIEQEVNVKRFVPSDERLEKLTKRNTAKRTTVSTRTLGEVTVWLDTEVTAELAKERKARELIRAIQLLRKEKGCRIDERVKVSVPTLYKDLPEELLARVQKETCVVEILWADSLELLTRSV